MNNQAAITLLKGLEQSLDDYCELNDEGKTAFRMAITALEVFGISEQLPSAQPERKTARWMPRGCGCFECDECGERVTLNAYTAEKASDRFRFCYHCGARKEEGGK